jgi:hypothetical protein
MRSSDRYPQLFPVLEQAKALEAYSYWNTHKIPTPFNGTIPKGEIGINPAYPAASPTVWVADICARGLLHPVEQLDVILIPRLTDLRMTALGKAAFARDQSATATGPGRATTGGTAVPPPGRSPAPSIGRPHRLSLPSAQEHPDAVGPEARW